MTTAPLTALTKNEVKFEWGPEQQKAFEILKQQITEQPVLRTPDFQRTFIVHTDASNQGMGAVLLQRFDDGEHPIAYFSNDFLEPRPDTRPFGRTTTR